MPGYTYQSAITAARSIVQDLDSDDYRYTDEQFIAALNMAISEVRRLRPDAWAGTFLAAIVEVTALNLSDPWPVDDMFYNPVVEFLAAHVELRDDEFIQNGRAPALLQRFSQRLLSPTL